MPEKRCELEAELQLLDDMETALFGIHHRATALPINAKGKQYVPRTARGKAHVPLHALPINARGRRYVPSPREMVATAAFQRFIEKDNLPMAVAKLAQIDPVAGLQVREEAETNPRIRRALNRLGSDVKREWPPKRDELFILQNFYATKILRRPLCGIAYDEAVGMIEKQFDYRMTPDRYRRILRKFRLS